MSRGRSLSPLGTQFDEFLHASLGEDNHGMQLSVLSELARHDIDPWQRAAHWSQLAKPAAIRELAAFIRTLPGRMPSEPANDEMARHLIDLLARKREFLPPATERPPRVSAPRLTIDGAKPVLYRYRVQILLGYFLFVLLSQWLFSGFDAPVRPEQAPAAHAGAVPHPSAMPTSEQ